MTIEEEQRFRELELQVRRLRVEREELADRVQELERELAKRNEELQWLRRTKR